MLLLALSAGAQVTRKTPSSSGGGVPRTNTSTNTSTTNGMLPGDPFGQADTTAKEEDNTPKGIDYDHVEEPDSALINAVFRFPCTRRSVGFQSYENASLLPYGLAYPDRLDRVEVPYYLSFGVLGHPHENLWVTPYSAEVTDGRLLPWFGSLPQEGYMTSLQNLRLYQTLRPYTSLGYVGSLNKDNTFSISHTQNIQPRWNVSVDYNLMRRDGLLTRSGVSHNNLDITTNYYSRDARYQLQAALIRNSLYNEENGGVASDEQFLLSGHSNLAGIPVHLYSASSRWKSLEAFVHQTWNTVRQFEKVKPLMVKVEKDSMLTDSIVGYDTVRLHEPRVLNTGVWGLDMDISRLSRTFRDMAPDGNYYGSEAVGYDMGDSLQVSDLVRGGRADLYWTNDAYLDSRWHNPLKITVGATVQYQDWAVGERTCLSPFAKAEATVGKNLLRAEGDYDLMWGDYRAAASWTLPFGLRVGLQSSAALPERQYLMYAIEEGDELRQVRQRQVSLAYLFAQECDTTRAAFHGELQLSASQVSNMLWMHLEDGTRNAMGVTQMEGSTPLLQARVQGSLRIGWLHYDMQHLVQYADQRWIRCPLYASKNSLYADFHMFHRALHVNAGFDLRYHTRYYANAWSPLHGLFYRQDEVQVGNYPWLDAYVALRIKQATIYGKATHITYFLDQERNNFLLPHAPSDDLGLFFGVIWQFFN